MKAEEITSEQAWEDFKAGYSDFEEKHVGKDREGDVSTTDEKLDVIQAKLNEMNTDIARLTDSVPQALGVIEEDKALETEEEMQEGPAEEMQGEPAEEGDLFGAEDDGLGDIFGDDEESDEESEDAMTEEETSEDLEDMKAESLTDDEATDEESTDVESEDEGESEEEDYIPIDDVFDEDESEEEPVEETVEEDESEEVLEKMVRVLEKMDARITRLERENEGLRKQLSKAITVKTQMNKSRPTPSRMKLVKGSYNRPPVSTQYVANQRDIGGQNTEIPSGNVLSKGLNDVFAECQRIAETR